MNLLLKTIPFPLFRSEYGLSLMIQDHGYSPKEWKCLKKTHLSMPFVF